MGLCKCPARKITRQFCFEHKVNVCEYCVVDKHAKCIVRPYLQWLDDSSYKSVCNLCKRFLASDECIRLMCYHIFHWRCLNNLASNLPSTTAPAGYTCPDCNQPMFPGNDKTPLSNHLRDILSRVQWTRAGLGLPILKTRQDSNGSAVTTSGSVDSPSAKRIPILSDNRDSSFSVPIVATSNSNHSNHFMVEDHYSTRRFHEFNTVRPDLHGNSQKKLDEDKYRRKSMLENFGKVFRSYRLIFRGMHPITKWIIVILLGFIGTFTFFHFLLKFGREMADREPMLDPHLNPNLNNEP